ncbi:hypothetical protein N781_08275 [Pontibacillus halophilus JSM 076056 = DSM 19796]|uniref:Lipoprotein YerB n=1 Tax=Pontibacillus halophilus JSM 076056 = DSM 19796 TaxID=1385510 RepID=A0A0A5GAM8_9BACI|nr:DUF3048 domain-containing protein [Pontibacillus halophilus]KGX90231.1 hypothetical protein N781_08275 [Pontibacillus halophilus JSM 076056 = DSM 19796]
MKYKWLGVATLLLSLTMTGCVQGEAEGQTIEKAPAQEEKPQQKEITVDDEATETTATFPLTGLPAEGDLNRRAVAVMVNNHSYARPQTGLLEADIVYEVLAEGDITRLVAIYHSQQPAKVGPVRSAREYYVDLANGHDALYLYHGAATFIENQMSGWINNLNGSYYDNDGKLFTRDQSRKAPHNSYLLFDSVLDVAQNKGYTVDTAPTSLPFSEEGVQGERASTVEIVYAETPEERVTYQYNEAEGHYIRFNDGEPTVDRETTEPVTLDNVFIVATAHKVIDNKGRRAVDLTSGGSGYLLQQGSIQAVEWKNNDGRLLPYKDGKPVGFIPGQTWVNIVPERNFPQSITME